jgi:sugar phosphate isomerase/epimerase
LALEVLGPHVKGVHCKDALRSPSSDVLGTEVPLGQGEVNFPALLARLQALDFRGPLVIEREGGARAVEEILAGRAYLDHLLQGC